MLIVRCFTSGDRPSTVRFVRRGSDHVQARRESQIRKHGQIPDRLRELVCLSTLFPFSLAESFISLHKTLVEHINSEIATRTIKTLQDAYKWLRSSFLYVRIKANPEHYRAIVPSIFDADDELGDDTGDIACLPPTQPINPEKRLEEMVADAVKQLKDEGLAEEIGDDEIDSTDYGDMLCQYSIRFPTFLSLKNMDPGANAQQLVGGGSHLKLYITQLIRRAFQLAQMCKAVEFKDLKFRSGEKSEYADWNKREEMQWPIRKVTDSSDKVNILIQVRYVCLSFPFGNRSISHPP